MTQFTALLADIPIGISALHEGTRETYVDHLTDIRPAFTLTVTKQALEEERALTERRSAKRAFPLPDAYLEEQWIYHRIGERLPSYGALLIHGSAVAVDGAAYLFTAPSGTGKSTHTRLWRQLFGSRAVMINDDKPLIKFEGNDALVCGSPWRGKHKLGGNTKAKLKGICLLNRAAQNYIAPVPEATAFSALYKQCYRSEDAETMLTLLDRLTKSVPVYLLGCNMEPEAAQIAYAGMNGENSL